MCPIKSSQHNEWTLISCFDSVQQSTEKPSYPSRLGSIKYTGEGAYAPGCNASFCNSVFSIAPWLAGEGKPFWKQEHVLSGWSTSYRQWWMLLSGLPKMSGRGERNRNVGRTIYCNFYNFPVIKAVITPWCFHWSAVCTVWWAKALERTPGSVVTHCMILGKGFM